MSNVQPRLLSVSAGAKHLGINRHDLTKYIADGLIAVVKLPAAKRPKLTIEALEAFIVMCEVGPEIGPTMKTERSQTVAKRATRKRGQIAKKSTKPLWYQKHAY